MLFLNELLKFISLLTVKYVLSIPIKHSLFIKYLSFVCTLLNGFKYSNHFFKRITVILFNPLLEQGVRKHNYFPSMQVIHASLNWKI